VKVDELAQYIKLHGSAGTPIQGISAGGGTTNAGGGTASAGGGICAAVGTAGAGGGTKSAAGIAARGTAAGTADTIGITTPSGTAAGGGNANEAALG
jgi:hypothetical protein